MRPRNSRLVPKRESCSISSDVERRFAVSDRRRSRSFRAQTSSRKSGLSVSRTRQSLGRASAPLAAPTSSPPPSMFHVKQSTRLETYEKLLRQWQKAVNLVAPGTLGRRLAPPFRRQRPASCVLPRRARVTGSTSAPAPAFRAWWWPSCLQDLPAPRAAPTLCRCTGGAGSRDRPSQRPASRSSRATPARAHSCARWSGKPGCRPEDRAAWRWISCRFGPNQLGSRLTHRCQGSFARVPWPRSISSWNWRRPYPRPEPPLAIVQRQEASPEELQAAEKSMEFRC